MTDTPATPGPEDEGYVAPTHLAHQPWMGDEEYERLKKHVAMTRTANARLIHELGQMGFSPEFYVSMLAVYFEGLVTTGVITKAQLVTIEQSWEEGFHQQLIQMHEQGKAAIEQAQLRSQLVVPSVQPQPGPGPNRAQRRAGGGKQGLILPGH